MPYGNHVCSHVYTNGDASHKSQRVVSWKDMAHGSTPFQVALGLPIAFSTILEGSVMEIKPAAPVPVDTMVIEPKSLAS